MQTLTVCFRSSISPWVFESIGFFLPLGNSRSFDRGARGQRGCLQSPFLWVIAGSLPGEEDSNQKNGACLHQHDRDHASAPASNVPKVTGACSTQTPTEIIGRDVKS